MRGEGAAAIATEHHVVHGLSEWIRRVGGMGMGEWLSD
jgi:hypothetical protein